MSTHIHYACQSCPYFFSYGIVNKIFHYIPNIPAQTHHMFVPFFCIALAFCEVLRHYAAEPLPQKLGCLESGEKKRPGRFLNGWLVVWNMFYFPINIGFLIIPIDVHIFQRGGPGPPTSMGIQQDHHDSTGISGPCHGIHGSWSIHMDFIQALLGYQYGTDDYDLVDPSVVIVLHCIPYLLKNTYDIPTTYRWYVPLVWVES